MKIIGIRTLEIPEIKVVSFGRFVDRRGYFTEPYRKSNFLEHPEMGFMTGVQFVQCNESFSKAGTVRGLHFQWNPFMGKLVRTIHGRMIDMVLDIRMRSPTFGKVITCEMASKTTMDYGECIWVPPGFAHGNLFLEDSTIEYLCSGEYSSACEAGISPLSSDIDWSLCDPKLKKLFDSIAHTTELITEKDMNGLSVSAWGRDERAVNFQYGQL